MNLEPERWSRRRWLCSIALVFLAQVLVVFFIAERTQNAPAAPLFRTSINLAVDPRSEQQLSQQPALSDPALFALPNLQGFSSAAWLTFAPASHQFTDWTPSDLWLELDTASLGKTFLSVANRNAATPLLIADLPLPPLPIANRHLNDAPLSTRSEIRVEGDLARRQLLQPIAPPPWPHSEILSNTTVQLLVNGDGDAVSHTLLSSCGSKEADQAALKLAARARFQSLRKDGAGSAPSSRITWGNMVFHWQTIPLVVTNSSTAPP